MGEQVGQSPWDQGTVEEGREVFPRTERVTARARFLAERIDLQGLEALPVVTRRSPVLRAGKAGAAVVFRYGALVTFNLDAADEAALLASLEPALRDSFVRPEVEEVALMARAGEERLESDGTIVLLDFAAERLLIVAEILAKSMVLARYEATLAEAFDRIEPLAERMRGGQRPASTVRGLLAQLGEAILTQTRTVGRVEVSEKPEITWDRPDLDRLFERLRAEYELSERDRALARKVELISNVTGTLIDLIQERQMLRVEWLIVILILAEIVLLLVQWAVLG